MTAAGVVAIADSLDAPTATPGQTSAETPVPSSKGVALATPSATAVPPPAGVTEDDAIAIARTAAPHAADWLVRVATAGPLQNVFTARGEFEWSRAIPPDRWIWQITLGVGDALDSRGTHVFLDYLDGTVYRVLKTRG